MADDQFQRPYRASEPPVRGAAKTPGSDPLAELARLIGQTDPFAEFGREFCPSCASAATGREGSDWNTQPTGTPYRAQAEADLRERRSRRDRLGNGYYASRSVPAEQQRMRQQVLMVAKTMDANRMPRSLRRPTKDPYQADDEARGYPPNQPDFPHDPYEHDAGSTR